MLGNAFPINPIRERLYYPGDLYEGLSIDDAASYQYTLDFRVYRHFVSRGGSTTRSVLEAMLRGQHDACITVAIDDLLSTTTSESTVAVMGGHSLKRNDPRFEQLVELGVELAKRKRFVVTGGGPGAMEAVHLGVSLFDRPVKLISTALATLKGVATLPDGLQRGLVDVDGNVNSNLLRELHAWQAPAIAISRQYGSSARSLGIPTWHYGFEPPTPFASHIGKYFQNSVREDGLVSVARGGIIFAPGAAGTLQEIFQDAAQNYYQTYGTFSRMAFFDANGAWSTALPVKALLDKLFAKLPDLYASNVLFSDDLAKIIDFVAP